MQNPRQKWAATRRAYVHHVNQKRRVRFQTKAIDKHDCTTLYPALSHRLCASQSRLGK